MLKLIDSPEEFNKKAGHVLQSWEWGEFRRQTRQVREVIRLGSYAGGRLVRVFQVFIHRVPYCSAISYFPDAIAYLPRSSFPDPSELAGILALCRREHALFLKMEPITTSHELVTTTSCRVGRPVLPRHTIYIDLDRTEEELLRLMHEKTRYNIRLAQRKEVIVRREESPEALGHFISLLEQTESRQGFYSHYPDYYRRLWSIMHPAKMALLLSAYLPGVSRPVAAVMLFRFKDFLSYPYGGSDPEYREYMAPHLLHWEAIKLGKELGCKTYDLWGSYKERPEPDDSWGGIYRFKKGFGGREMELPPTLDFPLSPLYPLYSLVDSLRWQVLRSSR